MIMMIINNSALQRAMVEEFARQKEAEETDINCEKTYEWNPNRNR